MTSTEIAVVIGGALLGFWVVNTFLGHKPNKSESNNQESDDLNSHDEFFQGANYQQTSQQSSSADGNIPDNWFHILEVPEYANKDEISRAYKQKISLYHPDKVATLGPELKELAEQKSKVINAAYDHALKLRG